MPKKMAILDELGIVINIIICEDDATEAKDKIIYNDDNPAHIGGDYVDGYFYSPQPFLSWIRNQGLWCPPLIKPDGYHLWNEELLLWEPNEFDPI